METNESQKQDEHTATGERVYQSGPFAGLTGNVIRLGLVSFFADISSEMLYPLTPIFLATVLHAPVAVIGVIEGVAEATASLLKTVSGRLSDLSGRRRPYVLAGYTLSAIGKPLIALAQAWPLVLVARVADRFGKGLRTSPRDALLADSIPAASRGKAFGWHRAMDTMGAVLGPLLALFLVSLTHNDLRLIFKLAFIPGIIGAALVFFVREHRRPAKVTTPPSLRFAALPPTFRSYLIAWGIFSLANSSDVFLILRAKSLGFSTTLVIILYALYNVIYAAASPSLGHLSDRIGRQRVLMGGLLIFALVYLGFAVAGAPWHIWVLFTIYGLYTAATDGVGKAFAVDLVPANIRASGLGMLATVTGLATVVASSVAGVLWTVVGVWAAFAYGALGALLCALMLARLPSAREVTP
ncbi:MAG TPA: MFS transporter [Armatimonadota bacterium]|jgi:MFS family permease